MTINLGKRAVAALLLGHCAGMLDLVALPLWMGGLIGWAHLDPQQAGTLVTLFLAGQVVSSLISASRFARLAVRPVAACGFAVAAAAFAGLATGPTFAGMAALHLLGGLGAGCALSVTHGTIGRSHNPHRLFAHAQLALALFGIAVLGAGPQLLQAGGITLLFAGFAGFIALVALVASVAFPQREVLVTASTTPQAPAALPSTVWFAIAGISLMSLAQAMIFSFVERIGADRGYGTAMISGAFIAVGLVNLVPAPLAAALQHRLSTHKVLLCGPLLHGGLALLLTRSDSFVLYATCTALFVCTLVFTHTFLFGLLARLDPSGRALAATPAMLMIGSCTGPLIGGSLVKFSGYAALGLVVATLGVLAMLCFTRLRSTTVTVAEAIPS